MTNATAGPQANITHVEGGNGSVIQIGTSPPSANISGNVTVHSPAAENATVPLETSPQLNATAAVNHTTPEFLGNQTVEHGVTVSPVAAENVSEAGHINATIEVALHNGTLNATEQVIGNVTHIVVINETEIHAGTAPTRSTPGHPSATPLQTSASIRPENVTNPPAENQTSNIGTTENRVGNKTEFVVEAATVTPHFLLLNALDQRGRRNALSSMQERMREETRELLGVDPQQGDIDSIPIHHERHIGGGRIFDDDASDGDIETDVSQSMWVLEPEEGVAGGEALTRERFLL